MSPDGAEATARRHRRGPVVNRAFYLSNHLLVRKSAIQLDVYAGMAEGTAAAHRLAEAIAAKALARL